MGESVNGKPSASKAETVGAIPTSPVRESLLILRGIFVLILDDPSRNRTIDKSIKMW